MNACFCCVRFSFFDAKPRHWLGETSANILCKSTNSVNQSINAIADHTRPTGIWKEMTTSGEGSGEGVYERGRELGEER